MFTSIWDDIKQQFSHGNMLTKIILVNIAVFVVINLVLVFSGGFRADGGAIYESIVKPFGINSEPYYLITHLWGVITSMFLHVGFMHILWNMILLYWFGRIFGDLVGDRRVLPLYLMGGLFGGLAFVVYARLTGDTYAIGASGAVMSIILATGVIAPDYNLRLILIGDVKLKYVVAVLLFLDIIGIGGDINTGGHYAHLGGAFFGYLFATQLQNGRDWAAPVNNFLDKLAVFFKGFGGGKKRGPRVAYKNPNADKVTRQRPSPKSTPDPSHQEHLDAILDKIKRNGYDSLSEEEKEFLFNASKK